MIYDEVALWGLTDQSSETEIWDTVFRYMDQMGGRASVSTVSDGLPQTRIISLQRMSDGNIYLMTSRGKPFYRQLQKTPCIAAGCLLEDTHHSLRIMARVAQCPAEDPVYREYAATNPGTMRMYRHNKDLIVLFRLVSGYGEILHLYRDDMVRRLRFGFGGVTPPPLTYTVDTAACTGCGACQAACAEQAIYRTAEGKYQIRPMDCDDCGICYSKCPLAGRALLSRLTDRE